MQSKRGRLFAALVLLACGPGGAPLASQSGVQPGAYIGDGGWGELVISRRSDGSYAFKLESSGVNGHGCGLDGTIRKGRAVLKTDSEPPEQCLVTFTPKANGIDVDGEGCRHFCGVRAYFDGLYLKPPVGCDRASVARTRRTFRQLFDNKAYAEARSTLQSVLRRCKRMISWYDIDWMRNDLALAQYRAGDLAACRKTLEPLREEAATTDEDLRAEHPPMDAEFRMRIAKATRTNLGLCKSPVK